MDELHVHTKAGNHKFRSHFKKPTCQKSDIKEVHNLKFRRCVGVVTHDLKIP